MTEILKLLEQLRILSELTDYNRKIPSIFEAKNLLLKYHKIKTMEYGRYDEGLIMYGVVKKASHNYMIEVTASDRWAHNEIKLAYLMMQEFERIKESL